MFILTYISDISCLKRFEIYATRDIEAGDELLHTYISLKWRTCFQELNEIVHADDSEHKTMD